MKKVLFFGGSSMLASMWKIKWANSFELYFTQNKKILHEDINRILNVQNFDLYEIEHFITLNNIDIVINCVGLTNVDLCQKAEDEANFLNIEIPNLLSKICFKHNIKFIQISTDHLFDGIKSYYSEKSSPLPLNTYAKTKLKAENLILKNNPESIIIRTNFIGFGTSYKRSFLDFILNNLRKTNEIELFKNVYFTPISIDELEIYVKILLSLDFKGIINISSSERISKFEFGKLVSDIFGFNNLKEKIKGINIEEKQDLVIRPLDMSLSNKKLIDLTQRTPRTLKDQLSDLHAKNKS